MRNKNKRHIPACHLPVQRPLFLDLSAEHQHLQLNGWQCCHNYHPAFWSLAQHLLHDIVCGKKWLDKTVPDKKCHIKIQERKRNFMNIIPSTCFRQIIYRCFLLMASQVETESVYPFPRNSIMPTSLQWRENNCV